MKKAGLIIGALMIAHSLFAQNGTSDGKDIMNYNGHWYLTGESSLDKEALRYQQLVKEKSAFDTLAQSLDKYQGRDQYNAVANDLDKLLKEESFKPSNTQSLIQLGDYIDLTKTLRNLIISNDNYRRLAALASNRVIKSRREGWSDDLYFYVLKESMVGLLDYLKAQANTDNNLMLSLMALKTDPRYQNCNYNIIVDTKMMDDPDMEMFICDRMEYILGADIYRYRETTPGIIKNYAKRKKESADLMGWLLQRATQDKVKFVVPISFSHNTADKKNEENLPLFKNADWYVFLFYKGFLYYSDALPKCDNSTQVSIMYKP